MRSTTWFFTLLSSHSCRIYFANWIVDCIIRKNLESLNPARVDTWNPVPLCLIRKCLACFIRILSITPRDDYPLWIAWNEIVTWSLRQYPSSAMTMRAYQGLWQIGRYYGGKSNACVKMDIVRRILPKRFGSAYARFAIISGSVPLQMSSVRIQFLILFNWNLRR